MDCLQRITSKDNPLIKLVCALQSSSKERKKNGLFVLEGLRICTDALENEIKFDKLIVSDTAVERYADHIADFKRAAEKCIQVPDSLFKKLGDTDSPQGVLAIVAMPEPCRILNPKGRYIALENVADPSNLGAISRTAEALGVSGILLSTDGCDPYSPKALRASMGTLLRMPLFVCDDLCAFIQDNGLRSFACVVDSAAQPISEVCFKDGDVLMIGNEANGLTGAAKESAFLQITIPMRGRAESFNAAAAAAIAMWQMMR